MKREREREMERERERESASFLQAGRFAHLCSALLCSALLRWCVLWCGVFQPVDCHVGASNIRMKEFIPRWPYYYTYLGPTQTRRHPATPPHQYTATHA